ncbi:MAG: T9SS type A sorting domain-containing protein, partial [Ignavibacteriota bacterium]
PHDADSNWSMRWRPHIGGHFGLGDSCWNVFLTNLPTDDARALNSAYTDIRETRAKIDELHDAYRAALQAEDSMLAGRIWSNIDDLFGKIRDDWQIIVPIIRENKTLLIRVRRECGAARPASRTGLEIRPVVPNPATDFANVGYNIKVSSNVLIQIFDQGGTALKTISDGNVEAGAHEMRLDLTGIRSGVYLLRIQAGADVSTEKFVIRN